MSSFQPQMDERSFKRKTSFSPTVSSSVPAKRNSDQKKRRTRSDKKTDIKVPVTDKQKQKLMIMARLESAKSREYISVTKMASRLVKKGLFEYEDFPEIEYDGSLKTVHVKLELFFVDHLFDFQLKWDTSMREAAARILYFMLEESEIPDEI